MAAHCSGCVFTVCVCTLDGSNAEHKFRVWVTILGRMSLHFHFHLTNHTSMKSLFIQLLDDWPYWLVLWSTVTYLSVFCLLNYGINFKSSMFINSQISNTLTFKWICCKCVHFYWQPHNITFQFQSNSWDDFHCIIHHWLKNARIMTCVPPVLHNYKFIHMGAQEHCCAWLLLVSNKTCSVLAMNLRICEFWRFWRGSLFQTTVHTKTYALIHFQPLA